MSESLTEGFCRSVPSSHPGSVRLRLASKSKMPSDYAKKKAAKKKEAAKVKGGKKASTTAEEKVDAEVEKSATNGAANGGGAESAKEMTAEGE